jgi:hypothetical protein
VNGKAICQRHVHGNEVNLAFGQARNKRHATRETVESAMTSFAPYTRHSQKASFNCGRALLRPLSTSVTSASSLPGYVETYR